LIQNIETSLAAFSSFVWGTPLLILLLGGGMFFLIYSRFLPFRYLMHAIQVLRGKYDDPDDPGEISHFEALSSALAATVGMGNISGVAVAIMTGGAGALFWMWLCAILGMATKFFTCSLAVMYRGKDSDGNVQGGPMYVIMEGLGKNWRALAIFFAVAGLVGCTPIFQANQFTQLINEVVLIPLDFIDKIGYKDTLANHQIPLSSWIIGVSCAVLVAMVIFGGIKRIGQVAGKAVPFMVVLYVLSVLFIILSNYDKVGGIFILIFEDAFTAESILGGSLGAIILIGAKRAAFSNEAGIGTAPMAHGAAKTEEPIREGLVAMLGPLIDTIVICTMTGLAILLTGVASDGKVDGVTLTAKAFEQVIPYGSYLLAICAGIFSITTMLSYYYYGYKCFSFLFGTKHKNFYYLFYLFAIILGAIVPLKAAISLIDGGFALMAIPTIISAVLLAPKVNQAAKKYFAKYA
jgi:AGCS family alanine or glycine:cation symporter